ncbi:MAG: hypothetical protein OXM55_07180 [Bdellovibrionales bacterium]|nr:hypothetical protein [Bdellovibrionales bacterium]
MKQIFVYVFFLTSLITVDSAIAAYSELSQESPLVLKARVVDTYKWSENNQKYSLKKSQFYFTVEQRKSGNNDVPSIIDEGDITQTAEQNARYLSISANQVAIESSSGKKKVVRSQLFEGRERLHIYFSNDSKDEIFNNLLVTARVEVPAWQNQSASHYSCQVNKEQFLVCSMGYVSKPVSLSGQ